MDAPSGLEQAVLIIATLALTLVTLWDGNKLRSPLVLVSRRLAAG